MTTRRRFLKGAAAAGLAFCSCCMLGPARAQTGEARRLPISVNGKRVKTIDVHAHCIFADALVLLGTDVLGGNAARLFGFPT